MDEWSRSSCRFPGITQPCPWCLGILCLLIHEADLHRNARMRLQLHIGSLLIRICDLSRKKQKSHCLQLISDEFSIPELNRDNQKVTLYHELGDDRTRMADEMPCLLSLLPRAIF
jgi:hypothetical protein